MPIIKQIEEIVQPIIESKSAFLIDVEIRGREGGMIVEIFIDNDLGITTDLCAEISREISRVLDATNIFQKRYHLIVSSPGIDRPLRYLRQYPKHVGRRMSVKYRGESSVEKLQGMLMEVTKDGIFIKLDNDEVPKIGYEDILQARIETAW